MKNYKAEIYKLVSDAYYTGAEDGGCGEDYVVGEMGTEIDIADKILSLIREIVKEAEKIAYEKGKRDATIGDVQKQSIINQYNTIASKKKILSNVEEVIK